MMPASGRAHLLSTALGLLMAAAAGIPDAESAHAVAALAASAALAVLVGIRFRVAGTFAVVLAGAAVMLSGAPLWAAGLTGLAAAGYLVLRHTAATWTSSTGSPAWLAAVGFTVVSVSATVLPLELPWLTLVAPPAVLAVYLLATWPYFGVALAKAADVT